MKRSVIQHRYGSLNCSAFQRLPLRRAGKMMDAMKLLLCLLFGCLTATADDGRVIATYGDAYIKGEEGGWQLYTAPRDQVAEPDAFQPLTYEQSPENRYWRNRWYNEDRSLYMGSHCFIPASEAGATPTHVILVHTLGETPDGELWLTHGNLATKTTQVEVRVLVNQQPVFRESVPRQRQPTLFQTSLGRLAKGDTIAIAIGSLDGERVAFDLHLTLESRPADQPPPPPAHILRPPADVATPKRAADGRPLPRYLETVAEHNQQLRETTPDLVFIGDSITARWPTELLTETFPERRALVMGYAGDWLQNTLWRVQESALAEASPTTAVVLIGTNNVTHRFTLEEISEGIRAIAAAIHAQSPDTHVVLMGIFPRGTSIHDNARYDTILAINARLAELAAAEPRLSYLDIGAQLVEPDGSISKDVMPDHLHIAMPGFRVWAAALRDHLNSLEPATP